MKTSLGSLVEEARWDFACGVVMMGRSDIGGERVSMGFFHLGWMVREELGDGRRRRNRRALFEEGKCGWG